MTFRDEVTEQVQLLVKENDMLVDKTKYQSAEIENLQNLADRQKDESKEKCNTIFTSTLTSKCRKLLTNKMNTTNLSNTTKLLRPNAPNKLKKRES